MCFPTGKLLHLLETCGFYKRLSLFLSLDAYKSPHSPYYQLPPKVQRHSSNQLLVTPTPPALQKLLGKAGMVRGASAWRFLNRNPRAASGKSLGTCVLNGRGGTAASAPSSGCPASASITTASLFLLLKLCPALHCVFDIISAQKEISSGLAGIQNNFKWKWLVRNNFI